MVRGDQEDMEKCEFCLVFGQEFSLLNICRSLLASMRRKEDIVDLSDWKSFGHQHQSRELPTKKMKIVHSEWNDQAIKSRSSNEKKRNFHWFSIALNHTRILLWTQHLRCTFFEQGYGHEVMKSQFRSAAYEDRIKCSFIFARVVWLSMVTTQPSSSFALAIASSLMFFTWLEFLNLSLYLSFTHKCVWIIDKRPQNSEICLVCIIENRKYFATYSKT